MSEQFYCCVFSYIDLELPPVLLSLHGFVAVYGAGALIDCVDPGTALDERSSCLLFIDRLSNGRSLNTMQSY